MSLRTEAKKTDPGSPFRAVRGKLEAPGLPAAGAAAWLVGRIAKDTDTQQAAKAGAEIRTSDASPLWPLGRRADCGRAATDRVRTRRTGEPWGDVRALQRDQPARPSCAAAASGSRPARGIATDIG